MRSIFWIVLVLAVVGLLTTAIASARSCYAGYTTSTPTVEAIAGTPVPSATPGLAEYHLITAEDTKARIDSGDPVVIVDVRTPEEFASGHIAGAINVPNEGISGQMPEQLPDLNAELLIYCRSGRRSSDAAHKLVKLGYTQVYDFGGIIDWPYDIE